MTATRRSTHFQSYGQGVHRAPEGHGIGPGISSSLPTPTAHYHGQFWATTTGTYVCKPDGVGGYEWALLEGGGGVHNHDAEYISPAELSDQLGIALDDYMNEFELYATFLPLVGGTLSGDLIVPAEVYGAGWNGSNEVPTKDAIYDKIESVVAGGGGLTVEDVQDAVGTILTDSASIDLTYSDATPSITAAAIFGTTATTVAAGNHSHTNDHVPVTVVDTTTIDLTLTGQQISAAAITGTTATTVAAGNHTHAPDHAAVTVLDTASIDLTLTGQQVQAAAIFGTTATTVAQGSHVHTNDHVPVTVLDTASIDLTLTGQQVQAAAIFGSTATTVAAGNHAHSGVYQPLDTDLTTLATNITPFGHSLVDDADAAAGRTTLGLVAGGAGDIWTEKAGDTMTGDLIVPDENYHAGWDGNYEVPTKNALYDRIEAIEGPGPRLVGITLLHAGTFSGVSSYSLPVGTFNSNYENYRVVINLTGSLVMNARLRASGVDVTTGYYGNVMSGLSSGTTVTSGFSSAAAQMAIGNTGAAGGAPSFTTMDIAWPADASRATTIQTNGTFWNVGGTSQHWIGHYWENSAGVKDSLTIYPASSTMFGTIRVYGYQNTPGGAGIGAFPAGADTQVQFNDAANLGGDAGLTYNKATDTLTVAGDVIVADEVYGVGWDGDLSVPTKNAVYDKIQTVSGGGTALLVTEGGVTVDATVSTLEFDPTDFNVVESPEDRANISLAYGTTAGTPAEGSHVHTNDHVPVTVLDTASIDLTLTGQQVQAAAIFGSTATTIAAGNHAHSGVYQPLDSDLTTLSTNITAAGHALVDDADAAAQRTTLGVIAGGAGDIWVEKAGDTMTGNLVVPTEAYGVSWNGSNQVPTKDAVYDKIELVASGTGITQAAADLRYLKLAADNDPLTGSLAVTGNALFSGTSPVVELYSSGAAADEKRWKTQANSDGRFLVFTANDLDSSSTIAMSIDRTGITPAAPEFAGLSGTGTRVVEASSGGLLSASGPLGMVHVGRGAIVAGVSGINIDSIFSATYDDYFFDLRIDGFQTTAPQVIIQFRAAGATAATANYYNNAVQASGATASAYTTSGATALYLSGGNTAFVTTALPFHSHGYISSPFRAARAMITNHTGYTSATGGARFIEIGEGLIDLTTSYDGIRISVTAGTFRDGEVNIYGLRRP